MALKKYRVLAILLVTYACTADAPEQTETADAPEQSDTADAPKSAETANPESSVDIATLPVQLVDSAITPAVAGKDGWNYHQAAEADLDGDGQAERVVMTARVELVRGRPAWDDGQPWQVYVEEPDGQRTYVYARRLQLGTLTMRLTNSGAATRSIMLLEDLPERLSVYEVLYTGPARVTVETRLRSNLDPAGETASPRFP